MIAIIIALIALAFGWIAWLRHGDDAHRNAREQREWEKELAKALEEAVKHGTNE